MSNGNDKFTKIYNGPNEIGFLSVGAFEASSLDSTIINGSQYMTVTGYAPATFSTLATGGILAFLTVPNATPATTPTDTRLLTLPAAAQVKRVIMSNNGVAITGGTSYNIGSVKITGSTADVTTTPTRVFVTAATPTIIGSTATALPAVVETAVLSTATGVTAGAAVPFTETGGNSLVTLVSTGNNTAGQLKIQITYNVLNA